LKLKHVDVVAGSVDQDARDVKHEEQQDLPDILLSLLTTMCVKSLGLGDILAGTQAVAP
jgi:hypothetical protein